MTCGKKRSLEILALVLSMAWGNASAAEVAGSVISSAGAVQAIDASGTARGLKKDDPVNAGDTLATQEGRAQIRFSDGALLSLQPRSRFRIDEYHYAGAEDGSERSFFSLLKGGFRTISGAIGHKNRTAYRVNTTVATIGIRGTAYNARLCASDCPDLRDGLHGQTQDGVLNVFNDQGSVDVPAGKSFYVPDANTPPELIEAGEIGDNLLNDPLRDPSFRAGDQATQLPQTSTTSPGTSTSPHTTLPPAAPLPTTPPPTRGPIP
ncbi:MAG: FecR family protein [Chromatiales bacterium]